MTVPKKRTSISKKRIRRNIWKKKGYLVEIKAFSLAKSVSTGGFQTCDDKRSESQFGEYSKEIISC